MEGVLKPTHIFRIWDILNLQINNTTRYQVTEMMSGGEANLDNFIRKLSTRWFQFTIRKASLMYFLEGRTDLTSQMVYTTIIKMVLDTLYQSGTRQVEMQVAMFNLIREGDMETNPLSYHPISAENDVDNLFRTFFSDGKNNKLYETYIPDIEQYIDYLSQTVDKHEIFCSARKARTSTDQMDVRIKFQLRRERSHDQAFLKNIDLENDGNIIKGLSTKGTTFMNKILKAYQSNKLDALDIAGVEDDVKEGATSLLDFTGFLRFAQKNGIPVTIHAGEAQPFDGKGKRRYKKNLNDMRERIYNNLATTIQYDALRIGHAVRLFDPEIETLLEKALERGIFLELNFTSNEFTGVADPNSHPIVRALAGDHPLFIRRPDLYDQLIRQVVICTDDPVIIRRKRALASEYQRIIYRLLQYQKTNPKYNWISTNFESQMKNNADRAFLPNLFTLPNISKSHLQ